MEFITVYRAVILFDRFNGVKAGRSLWKRVTFQAPQFFDSSTSARVYIKHFVDVIAPAANIRIFGWHVDKELQPHDPEIDIDPTYLPF